MNILWQELLSLRYFVMILLHVKIGTAKCLIAVTGCHTDIIIYLGETSFFFLLYIYTSSIYQVFSGQFQHQTL